ncbi:hypothetical protein [Streptosporangium roseum]|uniref:hypothetical protein n=1 Tax=Streptosporangium roseum TaxID=2001 RepID=UPI0033340CB2
MSKGKTNITAGRVAIQVGRIIGSADETAEPAVPEGTATTGTVTNVRSGTAKVGRQSDVIVGGLNIRM